jgi:hypothetical protein
MSKKSKATTEALEGLHGAIAKALADKIANGEATAADLAVARQFLKDNGIDAIPRKGTGLGDLVDSLPFPDADGVADEDRKLN